MHPREIERRTLPDGAPELKISSRAATACGATSSGRKLIDANAIGAII
jgi:hypothetical protein